MFIEKYRADYSLDVTDSLKVCGTEYHLPKSFWITSEKFAKDSTPDVYAVKEKEKKFNLFIYSITTHIPTG